jgi:hypothetical protein
LTPHLLALLLATLLLLAVPLLFIILCYCCCTSRPFGSIVSVSSCCCMLLLLLPQGLLPACQLITFLRGRRCILCKQTAAQSAQRQSPVQASLPSTILDKPLCRSTCEQPHNLL